MKTQFRNNLRWLFLAIIGLLLLLQLCNCSEHEEPSIKTPEPLPKTVEPLPIPPIIIPSQSKQKLLLFVDKSMSMDDDSLVYQKLKAAVNDALAVIDQEGEEVIISYLYENTGAKSNAFTHTYHPPQPQYTPGLNTNEQKIADMAYEQKMRLYNVGFREEIQHAVFHFKPTGKQTRIIETLPILKDWCKKGKAEITVLYLSDMIESSSFRSMRFYGSGITSHEKARRTAQSDFKRLQNREYNLSDSSLVCVQSVKIILPAVAMNKNAAFTYAPTYWSELLHALGVQQVDYQ